MDVVHVMLLMSWRESFYMLVLKKTKYFISSCWVRNWEHLISDAHTPPKPVGLWACDTAASPWSLLIQKECRASFLPITYLLNYLLTYFLTYLFTYLLNYLLTNWTTYLLQSCSMLCSIATNGAARCTLCSIALAHMLRIDNQAHGQDGRRCAHKREHSSFILIAAKSKRM